jgi:hypothetical protein
MLLLPSMRRRLLLGLGLTAIVSALASASCLSPTLPLPPPDVESITPAAEPGVWNVAGTCAPGALVTVLNEDTGLGAVFEDREETGHWSVQLTAEECDIGWVSQQRGSDDSPRTSFTIEPYSADQPGEISNCQ